jgi:hypothetical protein
LRAYTPRDQKAVQAAAQTFRANPKLDTATAITELGVGEALISFLDEKGTPTPVERAFVLPPASRIGPITPEERKQLMAASNVAGVYEQAVDRDSAYEKLKGRVAKKQPAAPEKEASAMPSADGWGNSGSNGASNSGATRVPRGEAPPPPPSTVSREPSMGDRVQDVLGDLFGGQGSRRKDTIVEAAVKSAARSIGSSVGREIVRGVLGSLLKRK